MVGYQPGICNPAGNSRPARPDLELFVLAKVLEVTADDLFPGNLRVKIKTLWPHYRVKLSRGRFRRCSKLRFFILKSVVKFVRNRSSIPESARCGRPGGD